MKKHEDGLRSVKWKRFLRAPDSQLLDELYVPALRRAKNYDRCCAYFSSRVLSVAARGFGGLINEQLDADDRDALLATGDQAPLIRKLLEQCNDPTTALEKNRLEMLSWLVASGWLELRVALMRQLSATPIQGCHSFINL